MGGSFNPAHAGHRAISIAAMRALGAQDMWWLVSPGNPLKPKADMAPLAARMASAKVQARRSRITPTAIERELDTRYTVDTLAALIARYPKRRFIWVMGADNLGQFSQWRQWRRIAQMLPIAVVARPGYDEGARYSVAAGWFRKGLHRPRSAKLWVVWTPPALVVLRFLPDARSATALRQANPNWHVKAGGHRVRDPLTRHQIAS
jgi:nicotinate-nucleotide adenylyltransferase